MDCQHAYFEVRQEGDIALLSVAGELDLAYADDYELACTEALDTGLPVVMSFEDCDFIDSGGLQGIVRTFNRATDRGQRFALAGSGPQVRRVLELSGMANLLPYFRRLEDAIDHVRQ